MNRPSRISARAPVLLALFFLGAIPGRLVAAHCACGGEAFPGAAMSAETQGIGSVALTLGFGFTSYERLSADEFRARASRPGGDGYAAGPELIVGESAALSWGLGQDWQLALRSGFRHVEGFKEAYAGPGNVAVLNHGEIDGVTDSDLQLKGRLLRALGGDFAVVLGATLPTGQAASSQAPGVDPQSLSPTGRPASLPRWIQPGKGSLDFSLGLAWSRALGDWQLDTSLLQTIPSTTHGYQVGERSTAALSFGRHVFERHGIYLDALYARAESDNNDGRTVAATGGAFASLGLRTVLGLSDRLSLSLALQTPLLYELAGQDLGQDGLRAQWQGAAGLSSLF